jgi:hypothetical protein
VNGAASPIFSDAMQSKTGIATRKTFEMNRGDELASDIMAVVSPGVN